MRTRQRRERGSSTLFVAVVALALFLIVGLVVDGGGRIKATQEADQIAREAARQAGQALIATDAMQGGRADLDAGKAKAAALAYIRAAGATGSATSAGSEVVVTVHTTYTPMFLSLIGIGTTQLDGTASTRSVRALDGKES